MCVCERASERACVHGLPLTSYLIEFVAHARDLRVLSLNAIGDATLPTEYVLLPRLAVLNFYEETRALIKITPAMFDSRLKHHDFNIPQHSYYAKFESGNFSNLTNVR